MWRLVSEHNRDKGLSNEDFLHGQIYAMFQTAHIHDLTKAQASKLIDALNNDDLVDAVMPPQGRVDQTERRQQEPQEPEWLAMAPETGGPGNDRWTAA